MKKEKSYKPITLANIKFLHDKGEIKLQPAYQRDSVWRITQKQSLIESILKDIDIPKLYFRSIDEGKYRYEVVDGQQRIRAVVQFMDNEYALDTDADPVLGEPVAGKRFYELSSELQMEIHNKQFDVTILNEAYTTEDIEDMFTRLQNGTPLNAPEKRRAIHSNMRDMVAKITQHPFFQFTGFKNSRFANEDITARLIHMFIKSKDNLDHVPTSKNDELKKTYELYKNITEKDASVQDVIRTLNFLVRAFRNLTNPRLKKFEAISLPYVAHVLLKKYDMRGKEEEFGKAFLDFDVQYITAKNDPDNNPDWLEYMNAARADDSGNLRIRHEALIDFISSKIQPLVEKDKVRFFNPEQRLAVAIRGEGVCQKCGEKCDELFAADHVLPHAAGGTTTLENAQLLCPKCNAQKGARIEVEDPDEVCFEKMPDPYSEEESLAKRGEDVKNLYYLLRDRIIEAIPNINLVPQKWYISFKAATNVADLEVQKSRIKVFINLDLGEIIDPDNITIDVHAVGHLGNGDYACVVAAPGDIEKIIPLIIQSYEKNK